MSIQEAEAGKEWIVRLLHEEAGAMNISVAAVRWLDVFDGGAELGALVDGTERRAQFSEEDLEDVVATPELQMRLRLFKVRHLLYPR
jgi:hypothetical protein